MGSILLDNRIAFARRFVIRIYTLTQVIKTSKCQPSLHCAHFINSPLVIKERLLKVLLNTVATSLVNCASQYICVRESLVN